MSNVDLAATILDAANGTATILIDGISLIPVAQNQPRMPGPELTRRIHPPIRPALRRIGGRQADRLP